MVVGRVVVVGRVFELVGVTTVRVTVLLGFVVVGVTVRDEVTVVVVVGFVVLELFGVEAEKSDAEAGVLEVVTLLVAGMETPELTG